MLNEVKHLGRESQVSLVALRVSRAMPGSFAAAQDDSRHMTSEGALRQTHEDLYPV